MIGSLENIVGYVFCSFDREQAMRDLRRAEILTVIQADLKLSLKESRLLQLGFKENTTGLSEKEKLAYTELYQSLADENASSEEEVNRMLVCFAVSEDRVDISRDGLLDSISDYEHYLSEVDVSTSLLFINFAIYTSN